MGLAATATFSAVESSALATEDNLVTEQVPEDSQAETTEGDPLEEYLPEDPTYEDFAEVVEEHPEMIPPDPGTMGEGLDELDENDNYEEA